MKQIVPVLFSLAFAALALAHPGGLDANGGHTDRKNGGYHYHGTAATGTPKTAVTAAPAPKATAPVAAATTSPPPVAKRPVPKPSPPIEAPQAGSATSPLAKITIGMTKAEVLAKLGEPSVKADTAWYYRDAGFVRFQEDAVRVIEAK